MAGIKWKNEAPQSYWQKVFRAGCLNIVSDVNRKAQMNAPYLTGALAASGKISATRDGAQVTYGSARVPYARIRHEVNHLHPGTTKYLARAAQDVGNGDLAKYFKQAI